MDILWIIIIIIIIVIITLYHLLMHTCTVPNLN